MTKTSSLIFLSILKTTELAWYERDFIDKEKRMRNKIKQKADSMILSWKYNVLSEERISLSGYKFKYEVAEMVFFRL